MDHEIMEDARDRAPNGAGWYSVCMISTCDSRKYPFYPPEVVFYDGKSDYITYDTLAKCKGGIQGIDSVAWWGQLVPDKPFPST